MQKYLKIEPFIYKNMSEDCLVYNHRLCSETYMVKLPFAMSPANLYITNTRCYDIQIVENNNYTTHIYIGCYMSRLFYVRDDKYVLIRYSY